MNEIFWLHIRKAGGTSIIEALGDSYRRVDRDKAPTCFIASERDQWNDILNNWRIPLGQYTFRRALFAKKYLYKLEWEKLRRFAASREPVSRCTSMFHYLHWRRSSLFQRFVQTLRILRWHHRLTLSDRDAFDQFLDLLEIRFSEDNDSIFEPFDLHFMTHTARMADDIYDNDGQCMLTDVFRLECIEKGVSQILKKPVSAPRINRTNFSKYIPTSDQRKKIEMLFARDFDVYEDAKML